MVIGGSIVGMHFVAHAWVVVLSILLTRGRKVEKGRLALRWQATRGEGGRLPCKIIGMLARSKPVVPMNGVRQGREGMLALCRCWGIACHLACSLILVLS